MVLFTLISQTPLIPLREPADLVKRNKVTMMLGVAIYLAFVALYYTGKIPESMLTMLPDVKILAGIVVADLILYAGLHKFQYGIFPIFSEDPEMKKMAKKQKTIRDNEMNMEEDDEDNDEDTITNSLKQRGGGEGKRKRRSRKQAEQLRALAMAQAQAESQRPVPMEDEDISEDQYLEENDEEEEPNELSMAEQDFFKNKNKTVVENWDVEDFSNMEMV